MLNSTMQGMHGFSTLTPIIPPNCTLQKTPYTLHSWEKNHKKVRTIRFSTGNQGVRFTKHLNKSKPKNNHAKRDSV